MSIQNVTEQLYANLRELINIGNIQAGQIIVIGCSTSEVVGSRIGTAGSLAPAQLLYAAVEKISQENGVYPAFQCCEHLNRALVVPRELVQRYPQYEEVTVIPTPKAGGSMASYAYQQLTDAVVIETIQAHGGIDIGDTLIGMHLRRVAVPVRPSYKQVGEAHVTMAYTRPKLIGGERAVYRQEQLSQASFEGDC